MKALIIALSLALFGTTAVYSDDSHPHPDTNAPTTEAAPAVDSTTTEHHTKKVTKKAKKAKKAKKGAEHPAEDMAAPAGN